jgi:hypothetical protein
LVGSYQTVVDSILDYVKLGAELISIRGYDNLNDAIDYGRFIIPGVRAALPGLEKKDEPVVPTEVTNGTTETNGTNGTAAPAS